MGLPTIEPEVNRWGFRIYPKVGSRYHESLKEPFNSFINDANIIREFTNTALATELQPLGSIRPVQITDNWKWSNGKHYFVIN